MEIFGRTAMLLGEDGIRRLSECRVAVFGLGGVGGYVVEALARSGVGALDLIDSDHVVPSNLNRQIIALHSTIGRLKTEVCEERVHDINPDCMVKTYPIFYLPETADQFDLSVYDYVVDAIDTISAKLMLAEECQRLNVPLISSMGTGRKLDPTQFEVADIYQTSVCPLAKVMRYECRKRGIRALKVVYSKEPAREAIAVEDSNEKPEQGKKSVTSSIAFVPSVAGLIIAGEVIKDLTGIRN
ncbi:MAG: tRNA threonylcarbamoyladenosine dehydratase [Firmicutes bacterium]|nr:tRNA threonylcarbamoyladenosine dehydratase [Bacillota bacterium]